MNEINFEYPKVAERINSLFREASNSLQTSSNQKVKSRSQKIPVSIETASEKLNIVFAGQYSAGKSSIIKFLTGREDIKIGSDITTDKVTPYDWNAIQIVDTPGIHTVKRPDHDEISYQAISNADLIVYVITNELFDSHMSQHFRKLAIDLDKAHEMLLVVNKMQREAEGNSDFTRNVLREDLIKVLKPFHPDDLQTTFLDAESALISEEETDIELKGILFNKSGVESFVDELNKFIKLKGLNGRLATPLYELEQVLQEAANTESSSDEDLDALLEILTQKRRSLLESKQQIRQSIENLVQEVVPNISEKGRTIAELIAEDSEEDFINGEIENARIEVQKSSDKLINDIEISIESIINELNFELSELANSEFAKKLNEKLNKKFNKSKKHNYDGFKKTGSVASKLGSFLANNSFNQKEGVEGLLKLTNFSGSGTHTAVLKIGKLVGHKFKPWEAVKWARVIGNAGKVLSVVGSVVSIVLEFKQDEDEKKMAESLREARISIRKGFLDVANELKSHSYKISNRCIDELLNPEIASVDKKIKELRDMKESQTEFNVSISKYIDEARLLISEVHQLEF
ncbi:MAG: GTPase [Candidatus Paceibacterota bacterium]